MKSTNECISNSSIQNESREMLPGPDKVVSCGVVRLSIQLRCSLIHKGKHTGNKTQHLLEDQVLLLTSFGWTGCCINVRKVHKRTRISDTGNLRLFLTC